MTLLVYSVRADAERYDLLLVSDDRLEVLCIDIDAPAFGADERGGDGIGDCAGTARR